MFLPVATTQAQSGIQAPTPPASITDVNRIPADQLFGSGVDGLVPSLAPSVAAESALAEAGQVSGGDLRQLSINVDIPEPILQAYINAAAQAGNAVPGCVLRWQVLAGVGRVESNHARFASPSTIVAPGGAVTPPIVGPELSGTNGFASIPDSDAGTWDGDRVWDRAVGPMQFIPSSWRLFGRDGSRDGQADPHNAYDAALGAAVHLCTVAPGDYANRDLLAQAVFGYNHSNEYVATVLGWIDAYDVAAAGGVMPVPTLPVPSSPVVVPPPLPSTPAPSPSSPLIPPVPALPALPPVPALPALPPLPELAPSAPLIPPLPSLSSTPPGAPARPGSTGSVEQDSTNGDSVAATSSPSTPAQRRRGPATAVPTPAPEPDSSGTVEGSQRSPGTAAVQRQQPRVAVPSPAPTRTPIERATPAERPTSVATPRTAAPSDNPSSKPRTEEPTTEEPTTEEPASEEPAVTYEGELVSGAGVALDDAEFSASRGTAVTIGLSSEAGVSAVSYRIAGDVTVVSRPSATSVEIARTPDDYQVVATLVLTDGVTETLTADFTVTD